MITGWFLQTKKMKKMIEPDFATKIKSLPSWFFFGNKKTQIQIGPLEDKIHRDRTSIPFGRNVFFTPENIQQQQLFTDLASTPRHLSLRCCGAGLSWAKRS